MHFYRLECICIELAKSAVRKLLPNRQKTSINEPSCPEKWKVCSANWHNKHPSAVTCIWQWHFLWINSNISPCSPHLFHNANTYSAWEKTFPLIISYSERPIWILGAFQSDSVGKELQGKKKQICRRRFAFRVNFSTMHRVTTLTAEI